MNTPPAAELRHTEAAADTLRLVLHAGCGLPHPAKLPPAHFPPGQWQEVRLDIDPAVAPDIVASITDMAVLRAGVFDAVWSAHNLEHLCPHEVPLALAEFRRVLKPGGFLLLTVPDLQQVAALVAEDRLTEAAYVSAAGPIAPLDMLYGHNSALAQGNHYMAHRGGFTATSLRAALAAAGFATAEVRRDGHFALWATATLVASGQAPPAERAA